MKIKDLDPSKDSVLISLPHNHIYFRDKAPSCMIIIISLIRTKTQYTKHTRNIWLFLISY